MIANLKKLRGKKGLSQQGLADVFGISQQSVNKYENHGTEPDLDTLIRMAEFFETSVDYLIGNTEIRRKAGFVARFELNGDEATVIENYRMLTPKEQESIRLVIENYMDKK